jgi:hypothetical protein
MSRFEDNLWRSVVDQHGDELSQVGTPVAKRARRTRPRVLAGSTLGLAGVGAALVVALGGTAATTPAFAIMRSGDGAVLVDLHDSESLNAANAKLAAMGFNEKFMIWEVPGAASVRGSVTCHKTPGSSPSGPPIKVLVGNDGTEVVGSSGNSDAGVYHLRACYYENADFSGNTGIPGAG